MPCADAIPLPTPEEFERMAAAIFAHLEPDELGRMRASHVATALNAVGHLELARRGYSVVRELAEFRSSLAESGMTVAHILKRLAEVIETPDKLPPEYRAGDESVGVIAADSP